MEDVDDEAAYQRQFESVVGDVEGGNDDVGSLQELTGFKSYTTRMLDVLGSDGEDEDVQGYDIEPDFPTGGTNGGTNGSTSDLNSNTAQAAPELHDTNGNTTIDDEIGPRKTLNGDISYITEDASSVSSFSLRAQRPWHFPAPRRLRMLRGEEGNSSQDWGSQLGSPSIQSSSDDGSRLPNLALMPYGEPINDLAQNGAQETNKPDLTQSFLRLSRLCILNDREGNPTVMAVASGQIAVGTKQGKVGLFDRSRGWTGAISVEGSVSALAISSDKTYLAIGTSTGHIYLYEMSKLHAPSRYVAPVTAQAVAAGRSEGHLQGSRILQLSFVGTRHTAIVSADEHGLSFYHSLGKILGVSSNDTLRILGRYPDVFEATKKSTTLAMAALPLGMKEHQSDAHNFVALLTPSKLILVGLKPSARTWYRRLSPARDQAEESICGCLAWLPSTFASSISSATSPSGLVQPTLAFSFGQHLYFIRLITQSQEVVVKEWKSYSHVTPIESMQWLSHEYLVLYTDQKIFLFDIRRGKCTEEQSIMQPVSHRWIPPRINGRQTLPSLNGSFRAHKGQLFVLTSNEIVVGSLVSWADRLLVHVSNGDSLGAIELATEYLRNPNSNGSRIGLPEHFEDQKPIIASRLMELMRASTAYAFSEDRMKDDIAHYAHGVDRTPLFQGLARVCAEACLALQDFSFLFDDLYDAFTEAGIEGIFADQMEHFIVQGQIRTLPIPVVQRLVTFRKRQERYDLAERIIRNVDPSCLDLDQAITLCLEHKLYDALFYVYTHALHDFLGPIVELIPLASRQEGEAYRIFSYLSVILLGRSYPDSQDLLEDTQARLARSNVYGFLFSGRCVLWPEGPGGRLVLTQENDLDEPTYPYLRLFLHFDAEAFLDVLDIAFEDAWLDDDEHWSRQKLIAILYDLDVAALEIGSFIAIFIARNAPKYPQFIQLSEDQVSNLIETLCLSTEDDRMDDYQEGENVSKNDRQFAVECLLSAYKPTQTDALITKFVHAGFTDILRRVYRKEEKWDKLAEMVVQEANETSFEELNEIMRKGAKRTPKVEQVVLQALPSLVDVDVQRTASLVKNRLQNRMTEAISVLDRSPHRQLAFLDVLMDDEKVTERLGLATRSQYIALLSSLEPTRVIKCLDSHPGTFFDLDYVIEVARDEDVLDALLWAQDRAGTTEKGFADLSNALTERALIIRNSEEDADESQNEEQLLAKDQVHNLGKIAVRICVEHSDEELWVKMLKSLIQFTHDVQSKPSAKIFARTLLQDSLSAFVSSTSAENVSFSNLFNRLIPKKDSTYAEARDITNSMTGAYRVRQELLGITNSLFDRDVFTAMQRLTKKRRRGWRPASSGILCPGCGRPCIGENRGKIDNPMQRDESQVMQSPFSIRRKSEINQFLPPPKSPSFLDPVVSPKPDKGKGVARDNDLSNATKGLVVSAAQGDMYRSASFDSSYQKNGNGGDLSSLPASNGHSDYFSGRGYDSDPVETFLTTPQISTDYPLQTSISMDSMSNALGKEAEEEENAMDSVVVCFSGEVWHRSCAPVSLWQEAA